ncbi:uncharacterized protein A1O5_06630 [Cladophialophora psammophila CBS 110553]|uniref:VOC domain-containing protein n=1 Tax=Cladophialophora psammophila CBS 110553 TaxID=1182543 RepID=W9WZR3_9EURO|nr:uncharacterized protein A1O5_06630 [Cladophialophora psammophila CBS 110553]EXJ70560.1 hypothetical protein A1O5_06630 [Cladophialophora psammophila CBS 110553]
MPHRLSQDDYYNGYYLPKGALIHGNQWAINGDQSPSTSDTRPLDDNPYRYVAEPSPSPLERRFVVGAFVAQSYQELEKVVKLLPGASPVRKAEGPRGGFVVEVHDPNGHSIRLVHGQQEYPEGGHLPKSQYNTSQDKERLGKFHRFKHGPSKVHELGHFGFMVPSSKFLSTRIWYLNTFNLLITDSVFDGGTDRVSALVCLLKEINKVLPRTSSQSTIVVEWRGSWKDSLTQYPSTYDRGKSVRRKRMAL